MGGAAPRGRPDERHRAIHFRAVRFILILGGYPRLQFHERGHTIRSQGFHRTGPGAGRALLPDGERIAAPLHRPPDVRALAHLDRGAVGGDLPGGHMVARDPLSQGKDIERGPGTVSREWLCFRA